MYNHDTEIKNDDSQNVTIEIIHLFAKEQNCKVPHSYQTFQSKESTNPEHQTELSINTQSVTHETFEITLNVTVTARIDLKTAYTAHVQQACIIKTNCRDEHQLSLIANVHIPQMIYPYARKTIGDLITNTGFPTIFLPIVDFGTMNQERLKKAKSQIAEATDNTMM